MEKAIISCDVQAQRGQPLTPPSDHRNSPRIKLDEFVSLEYDTFQEIIQNYPEVVEVFFYVRSYIRERSDVVTELAAKPWRSRDVAVLSQTVAELDEMISKINIVLQVPDIGEGAFPLIGRLLFLEGSLRGLRFGLFPYTPDVDRVIRAIEIASQFYDSPERFLESSYAVLKILWSQKRSGMITDRLHSLVIGLFSEFEEALNMTTEVIGCVQSNPWAYELQIGMVARLYGMICTIDDGLKSLDFKGKSIPVIAGVLSIQGTIQAYRFCFLKCIDNIIRSIPTIQTLSDSLDHHPWVKTDTEMPSLDRDDVDTPADLCTSQMLDMGQREVLTFLSRKGTHYSAELLCQVLLHISMTNDRLPILSREVELRAWGCGSQSRLLAIVGKTICIIDSVLQIVDIDESVFELVVGLLLSQLYALVVYSRVCAFEEQLPSSCGIQPSEARYPDYSDRINYILEVIPHFCGPSEYITGVVLSLSNRFRWPHELSAFFALSCINQTTQSTEHRAQLQEHILVQYPRFTSTELAMAVMPLVTAVGAPAVIIRQGRMPCSKDILQSCMYLPGIEDAWTRVCLRDYGAQLSAMCSSSDHNVCLSPHVFGQILTFVDLCVQHHIVDQRGHPQPDALPTWSPNEDPSREDEKLDEEDLEWRMIAVHILYGLLKVAAIAGDTRKLDAVTERLQLYTLPHRQCESYLMARLAPFDSNNELYLALEYHFKKEWHGGTKLTDMKVLNDSITSLKMQFHSEHLNETHKAIVAFILAFHLFYRGNINLNYRETPRASGDPLEANPYFGYFLRHWPYPLETSWTTPSYELLYRDLLCGKDIFCIYHSLVQMSVHEIWDQQWKQESNSSRDSSKQYQPRRIQKGGYISSFPSLSEWNFQLPQPNAEEDKLSTNHDAVDVDTDPIVNLEASEILLTSSILVCLGRLIKIMISTYNRLARGQDTGSKLVNVLDVLEHIVNDPRIPRHIQLIVIILWCLCMFSMLFLKINILADVKERCKASLLKMSAISWTMLEEMSWTASSIWESIADRQVVFKEIQSYLAFIRQALFGLFSELVVEDIEMWDGSGMIWTQLQHLRSPLDHLANINQKLANRLRTLLISSGS